MKKQFFAIFILSLVFFISCGSAENSDNDGDDENLISTLLNVYYLQGEDEQLVLHGETLELGEMEVTDTTEDKLLEFKIKNISEEAITLTGSSGCFVYSGADSAYFSTQTPPVSTTIAPLSEDNVTARYSIVKYNEGLKSVTVSIPNDTRYETYSFSIELPTTAVPEIDVSGYPNGGNYNFGGVTIGSPESYTFSISNTGFGRLRISSVTIEEDDGYPGSSSDFSIPELPALPDDVEDQLWPVEVLFSPSDASGRYCELKIVTNDTGEEKNPYIINLCGQGYSS